MSVDSSKQNENENLKEIKAKENFPVSVKLVKSNTYHRVKKNNEKCNKIILLPLPDNYKNNPKPLNKSKNTLKGQNLIRKKRIQLGMVNQNIKSKANKIKKTNDNSNSLFNNIKVQPAEKIKTIGNFDTAENLMSSIFCGIVNECPEIKKRIVRIFLSSTFTDTTLERNIIMKNAYPRLKEYCKQIYGLDFQIVDMRWGIRDEATDDQKTTEICLQEIENCKRLSIGPRFVALLGDKYGYRPVPRKIPASEFEKLKSANSMSKLDLEILHKWYQLDKNIVPEMFVLQPISSILVNYNNKNSDSLMEADMQAWWDIQARLQRIFRCAAYKLRIQGMFTEDEEHNYYISVTEREVLHGIINDEDPNKHCLCFIRELEDIKLNYIDSVKNYMDVVTGKPDKEAQILLKKLKNEKVSNVLSEDNIIKCNIPWRDPEGMNSETHKEYLQQFTDTFVSKLMDLIQLGMQFERDMPTNNLYYEISSHLNVAQKYNKDFHGRDESISEIKKYLLNVSETKPMILKGEPGSGKSALVAKSIQSIIREQESLICSNNEIENESVFTYQSSLILRFVGTTPRSSKTVSLFQDILEQLYYLFKDILISYLEFGNESYHSTIEKIKSGKIYEEPGQIIQIFLNLIQYISLAIEHFSMKKLIKKQISKNDKKPYIFIFIDAIDQLHDNENKNIVENLATKLPLRVKMILTVLADTKVSNDFLVLHIKSLDSGLALKIIKQWLTLKNRNINNNQLQVVTKTLEKCSLPLLLKIIIDEISSWPSYFDIKKVIMYESIEESIHKLLEKLEITHGKILVMHSLSYITASRTGLSESELEDILSLDEIVLNDVYQYHLPPIRRIPPLLWSRIRTDIYDYITERESDYCQVIYWYHQQFTNIIKERYFTNDNFRIYIHSILADFFSGKWAGVSKPFTFEDIQRLRFGLASTASESDRFVSFQPLFWHDKTDDCNIVISDIKITKNSKKCSNNRRSQIRTKKKNVTSNDNVPHIRYNFRKLNELPFHLFKSKKKKELFEICLFNFQFLFAKVSALPLMVILQDFQNFVKDQANIDDLDVFQCQILSDCFRLSSSSIKTKPNNLGPQIVGRLLPYINDMLWIKMLINQIRFDTFCLDKCALVPLYPYLETPGGPLEFCFDGIHQFPQYCTYVLQCKTQLITISNKITIFNLLSGEMIYDLPIKGIKSGSLVKYLKLHYISKTLFACTNGGQFIKFMIDTMDIYLWDSNNFINEAVVISGFIITDDNLIMWFSDENNSKNYIYQYNINTFKIILRLDNLISDNFHLNNSILQCEYINSKSEIIVLSKFIDDTRKDDIQVHILCENVVCHSYTCICGYYFNDIGSIFCSVLKDPIHLTIICYVNKINIKLLKYSITKEVMFGICLSPDNEQLVGIFNFGFKIWSVINSETPVLHLSLPKNTVNVQIKNQSSPLVQFSKNSKYLIAAVKQFVIIYDLSGNTENICPLTVISAHSGRIISLKCIFDGLFEKIITSSIDKSVKVWNLKNSIERKVQSLDKMDRPIEGVCVSQKYVEEYPYVLTFTRSAASLWNLQSGKIQETFSSQNSLIINCHLIIDKHCKIIICESKILSIYYLAKSITRVDKLECDENSEYHYSIFGEEINKLFIFNYNSILSLIMCNIYVVENSLSLIGSFNYSLIFKFNYMYPKLSKREKYIYACDIKNDGSSKYIVQFTLNDLNTLKKIKLKKKLENEIELYKYEIICIDSELDNLVTLKCIDSDYGYLFDFKQKRFVKKIDQWSGPNAFYEYNTLYQKDLFGLYAPSKGGLEVMNLKTNKTVQVLLDKSCDGIYKSFSCISKSQKYAMYFRESKPILYVFCLSNGQCIAEIHLQSNIKCLVTTISTAFSKMVEIPSQFNTSHHELLHIGCFDGSFITLVIMNALNSVSSEII